MVSYSCVCRPNHRLDARILAIHLRVKVAQQPRIADAPVASTFDGEAPQSFTLFPGGHYEDSLVLKVTFPAGRGTVHRLYSNLGESASPTPARLVLERIDAGTALLRIEGAATTRHRLMHSTNLNAWLEHAVVETSPSGTAEQTVALTNSARFFRADALAE